METSYLTDQKDALGASVLDAIDPARILVKNGIVPDDWQLAVLRSNAKRILLCCSRQSGKSTVSAAIALHTCLYIPNSLVLIVSKAQRQSEELLRKARELWKGLGTEIALGTGESESLLKIEFKNGSRLLSLPGENSDAIRGFKSNLTIVDEASMCDEKLFSAVLPMLLISGGRMIALSTPRGRQGWFWRQWSNPDTEWMRVRVTVEDIMHRIDLKTLNEHKATMTEAEYEQEYLCAWLDSSTDVFSADFIQYVDAPPFQWEDPR